MNPLVPQRAVVPIERKQRPWPWVAYGAGVISDIRSTERAGPVHGERLRIEAGDALLVVDVQNDFLPGGALGVAQGERVLRPLRACIEAFETRGLPVFASRDWHPPGHCSFQTRGGPWPAHAVADSAGAAFATALGLSARVQIVSKGCDADRDAYSAFEGTDLASRLRALGVRRLVVGGLATDYCVQATVLDALAAGWPVIVLRDAIAAVDLQAGDGDHARARMREAGAIEADSAALLAA
jgi:nicotinamidase/pyrazinamidase